MSADADQASDGLGPSARRIGMMGGAFDPPHLAHLRLAATALQSSAGGYALQREGRQASSEQMIEMLADWVQHYPVVSIEDGLGEEDWPQVGALAGAFVVGLSGALSLRSRRAAVTAAGAYALLGNAREAIRNGSGLAALERLRALGCDVPINYRSEDFVAVIRERTQSRHAVSSPFFEGAPA